jgi:ribonuclease III
MIFQNLQETIGYYFLDEKLLIKALTHRSYINVTDQKIESKEHNERLEFLGDAILEMIVTEFLFDTIPESEGHLTALRASLVNSKSLCEVGKKIGLSEAVLISKGEKEEYGKARDSIVTDSVEALIGAMYLDSGLKTPKKFIHEHILSKLPLIIKNHSYRDPKTSLQEYTQQNFKKTPRYKVLNSTGKDHEKIFECGVYLGLELLAKATGKSKQEAETMAAKSAYSNYQPENNDSNS